MKKLTAKKGVECMACLECVRACSTAFYKEFDPAKACLQIVDRKGAAKPMLCVQCGKCAEACPNGAITQNAKGVYTVNKKLCTGCGKCVEAQATRLRHSTTTRSNARSFFMVSFSFLFRQHHTIRQADLARIFSSDQGFGKCRNTVCISNFSNRRAGEKGPSKRAGAIMRCCPYLS